MASIEDGIEMCPLHSMVVEYFCQSHDQLGCQQCIQSDHQGCENMKAIDELTEDIETSKEYKQFQDDINEIRYISNEITENINEREDYVKAGLTDERETVDRLRADINAIFDCIQDNIEEKESNATVRDTAYIEKFTKEADSAISELESIENKLENLKRSKKFREFFITLKRAKPDIRAIENDMEKLVTHSKPQSLAKHAVLPEVKGETEVNMIKLEEAVIQFKMLISKSNLTQQE